MSLRVKITLTFLALIILAGTSQAQNSPRFGLGIEAYSSGNSLGTFFRPYAGYEFKRNFISAGFMVQKQSGMIKGAKIAYSRNLSAETYRLRRGIHDLLQINLTGYLQYSDRLPMCGYAVKEQYCASGNKEVRWEKIMLSTVEAGAGFEVRLNFTRSISWRNSTALAVHYHTEYAKGLSRERCAVTLGLCTGLLLLLD